MNGAARLLAEAEVDFGMVEVEVMSSEEFKLVLGEAQFPGNICPPDEKSVVMFWGEGHGTVVK